MAEAGLGHKTYKWLLMIIASVHIVEDKYNSVYPTTKHNICKQVSSTVTYSRTHMLLNPFTVEE